MKLTFKNMAVIMVASAIAAFAIAFFIGSAFRGVM